MEELVPVFEKEGINLHVEPHPQEWCEILHPAVDMAQMIRDCAPVLAHVHVADTLNHKASSGLRYIVNPPGAKVTVHQHLDIGQGEVGWDVFFGTLAEFGFDGIMTACVFAWEDRAEDSSRFMRREIQNYIDKYWKK